MRLLLILILTTGLGLYASATAQYPDKILYKGKEYSLHTNPLEEYFDKNPGKRPEEGVRSTALWRGYVATFELKDNQLWLKDIQIEVWDTTRKERGATRWKSVIGEVFPGDQPIKVDWLTGLLVLPYGKLVNYVHMGYGSTYQHYILLEVDKGDLKREKQFGYKEYEAFREKQFQAFKLTEEYKKLKADLRKDGNTDEFIDDFLKGFVIQYSSRILVE